MKWTIDLEGLLILALCWITWGVAPTACGDRTDGRDLPPTVSHPGAPHDGVDADPGGSEWPSESEVHSTDKTGGGPCAYKIYSGSATIISVHLEKRPKGYPGPPYKSYDVRFLFSTKQRIDEVFAQVRGKPQRLALTNSWSPGPQFLQKYGIAEGKTFDCRLKVITRGTCTPVVFAFPAINLSDYFESRIPK